MHIELDKNDQQVLEALIDRYDTIAVISALSFICSEKSVHIAENWQDVAQAKQWMHRSTILDRCHVQLEELVD